MSYETLIGPQDLYELCGEAPLLIVDARHDLADTEKGARAYAERHLPGAVYAHLDRDLSDLRKHGLGRHPLPDAGDFAHVLARWGYTGAQQVVVYDDGSGAIAARLWWMLRLVGHRAVAVLEGGFPAWAAAGLELTRERPLEAAQIADLGYAFDQVVYVDELQRLLGQGGTLLLDARAAPRFRGEVEPIDPVAGHVPGARNRPYSENLDAGGRFKHADALREEFEALLGAVPPERVVHMCGSGVTACHNLLAMEHAGLAGSRVFAPSWSGWIADRARPVAQGG
jgi:thiosulfate/3-mercaptopyruvate sulfurtransferase